MIGRREIRRAIALFRDWDNNHIWVKPSALFISHTKKKSRDSLDTALVLARLMEDRTLSELAMPGAELNSCLWIVNSAYYSMFFMAQALLAEEGKKLPENARDTHKTIFLAMLYYYLIKGSGLEGKKDISWEDIKHSRFSDALMMLGDAMTEAENLMQLSRAKQAVESLGLELEKRNELTYRSTLDAELSFAKTSIERAQRFSELIGEYRVAMKRGS